jgi:hypothetical protein
MVVFPKNHYRLCSSAGKRNHNVRLALANLHKSIGMKAILQPTVVVVSLADEEADTVDGLAQ